MHQGATLDAREDGGVELLRQIRVVCDDHAATRTAQGLVGGGGGDIRMREGRGVLACGHETGEVGHVDHQPGADAVGHGAELGKVDLTRNGGAAAAMISFGWCSVASACSWS